MKTEKNFKTIDFSSSDVCEWREINWLALKIQNINP